MPKLVLIFGPQAVGKMTVGQELTKITGLKLLHNHMSIELLLNIFDHGSPSFKRLDKLFRMQIFEEVSKSDMEGLIFTFCWDFDDERDNKYVDEIVDIFKQNNGEIYFVELEADLEERLKRNKTSNRLENKPSKRNLEWSEKDLIKSMDKYRLNSNLGEIKEKNYLKINNSDIQADEVAKMIKDKFDL